MMRKWLMIPPIIKGFETRINFENETQNLPRVTICIQRGKAIKTSDRILKRIISRCKFCVQPIRYKNLYIGSSVRWIS